MHWPSAVEGVNPLAMEAGVRTGHNPINNEHVETQRF